MAMRKSRAFQFAQLIRQISVDSNNRLKLSAAPTEPMGAVTKSYVDEKFTLGTPALLDTLDELAAAMGDDPDFMNSLVAKTSVQALAAGENALTISGSTITLTRGDGTTDTITVSTDNNYLDTASFDTSDGNLTLGRNGSLSDITVDLDGRYSQTDTVYDSTAIDAAVSLNTAKVSNISHPLVQKAVPTNALFTDTDTVYTHPSTHAISKISGLQSALDGKTTESYVDTKVSDLVASSPATLDTLNELAAALGDDANHVTTMTNLIGAKLSTAGGTMTGNLLFADSVRARFGASNDLQIFHDGSNSYIENTGTGDLILQDSDGDVRIKGKSNEDSIVANNDGSVQIFYDNVEKLATTSSGIDVTGTATINGNLILAPSSNTPYIMGGTVGTQWRNNANNATLLTILDGGNVGIGTSSPSAPLDAVVNSTTYAGKFTQSNTSNGDGLFVQVGSTASSDYALTVRSNAGNTAVLSAKADGNVGIGTFSPSAKLHLYEETSNTTTASNVMRIESRSSGTTGVGFGGTIYFLGERADGGLQGMAKISAVADINTTSDLSSALTFQTASGGVNSERLRIDSSGNSTFSGGADFSGHLKILTNGNLLEIADAAIQWYSAETSDYKVANMRASSYNFKGAGNSSIMTAGNSGIDVTGTVTSDGFQTDTANTSYNLLSRNSSNTGTYIQQAGSGSLLEVRKGSANAGQGSAVLAVTQTGIDVTGTVTADGLTVQADVDDFIAKIENDGNSTSSDGLWVDTRWNTASNTLLKVTTNSGTQDVLHVKGDGNVGIGTSSPSDKLHVNGTARFDGLITEMVGAYCKLRFRDDGISDHITIDSRNLTASAKGGLRFTRTDSSGNSSESMRINSSGNMGLGVTPESWFSGITAMQIGGNTSLAAETASGAGKTLYLFQNAYVDSTNNYKYQDTDEASMYFQHAGKHVFRVAPSGSAGSAISWTDAITIDNSGNVGIGTNPSSPLHVSAAMNTGWLAQLINTGTGSDANGLLLKAGVDVNDYILRCQTGAGAEVLTAKYNGRVGIGTTSPDSKLEIYNNTTSGNTQLHIHNDKTGDAAVLKLEGGRTADSDTGQIVFTNSGNNTAAIKAYRDGGNDAANLQFFTSASGSGSSITERLRISATKATKFSPAVQIGVKQREVSTWETAFWAAGTTATNWDMTTWNEGGNGNCFFVTCGFAHYASSAHGISAMFIVFTRGTDVYVQTINNHNNAYNGYFSVSKASATTLRISKSAGTYTGTGNGFISVKSYNNT